MRTRQEMIAKPTLDNIVRHGGNGAFYEPMEYGGMEDDSFSSLSLGGAAIGLVGAIQPVLLLT